MVSPGPTAPAARAASPEEAGENAQLQSAGREPARSDYRAHRPGHNYALSRDESVYPRRGRLGARDPHELGDRVVGRVRPRDLNEGSGQGSGAQGGDGDAIPAKLGMQSVGERV